MKKTTKLSNEFIIKKGNIVHNNKFDYSLMIYENAKTPVDIICKEHGVFKVSMDNHLNKKSGCPKCSKRHHYTNDELVLLFNNVHSNKYQYNLENYKNNKSIISIKCPNHGEFNLRIQHHINGVGCSRCNDSKGEKKITQILSQYNIKFEIQKSFEDCVYIKKLKYDFYLTDYNTCLEFDGEQHFNKFRFEKDDSKLKERLLKDEIKNNYCKTNNINLVRIPYFEFKNIEDIIHGIIKLKGGSI